MRSVAERALKGKFKGIMLEVRPGDRVVKAVDASALMSPVLVFFFFQAEDGIRDVAVTGVQTCALPIYPSALLMIDIDHFKAVNDRYGHPAGDQVIREVAALLRDTLRHHDIPGRYGGEIGRASCRERV